MLTNETIKNETWKDLVLDGVKTDYRISNLGRMINKNGKLLRPIIQNTYYTYELRVNGKRVRRALHRLVATAFIKNDNPEIKTQVHHIDGNKFNNSIDNLQWISPSEHSRITRELNWTELSIISEEKVRAICRDIESGKYNNLSKIARKNGISNDVVNRIYRRISYSNISLEYDFSRFKHKGAHKNRNAYLSELEEMIKRGMPRYMCIQWLMNTHGLEQKDAEYIHDRRRQVILRNDNTYHISDDQKEKYTYLFLPIEEMLLGGLDIPDTIQVVLNTLAPEMPYTKAKDLVRQRARAIIEGKNSVKINLVGREYDVAKLRQLVERRKRRNHVDKYVDLYIMVEKRILDGDKFMDIAYDLMSEFNLKKSIAKNIVGKRCKAIIDNKPYVLHIGYESEIKALKKKYKKYLKAQEEYKKTHPYED